MNLTQVMPATRARHALFVELLDERGCAKKRRCSYWWCNTSNSLPSSKQMVSVSYLSTTTFLAFVLLYKARRVIGSSPSLSSDVSSGLYDVASFPWGCTNIGRRSCPVRYPWSNETKFCLSVGRQRSIVSIPTASPFAGGAREIACATIPWRLRSDLPNVDSIAVFVTTPVGNFTPAIKSGDRIEGEVCFETIANVTSYAIYYLPIAYALDLGTGSYHSHYLTSTAQGVYQEINRWLTAYRTRRLQRALHKSISTVPAQFVRFESQSSHDVRSPMEFSASNDEVAEKLLNQYPSAPYLTWVSLIENTTDQTIRMKYDVPLQLITSPPNRTVSVPLDGGVRIVQVILYAARKPIHGVVVDFPSVSSSSRDEISLSCLQTSGSNYRGEDMVPPPIELDVGQVGQVMVMVYAKEDVVTMKEDIMRFVRISPYGLPETTITVNVTSSTSQLLNESGLSDVWRLSRLKWLNSKTGLDQAKITRPYTPIVFTSSPDGKQWTFECRGRTITVCKRTGLPVAIESNGRSILSSPMTFELAVGENNVLYLIPLGDDTTIQPKIYFGPNNASAWWFIPLTSLEPEIKSEVRCVLTYDGHLDYSVAISSSSPVTIDLDSASLVVNVENEIARFAVGGAFGSDGDWFPSNASRLDWYWNETQSGWRLWVGHVDAGLYMKLKGVDDAWNEANPVEAHRPLSWSGASGNTGGIKVSSAQTSSIRIVAFSGPLRVQQSPLIFNFSIIATPTKGDYIHTDEGKKEHYKLTRHYHVPYGQWEPPPDPCNIFNTTLSQPTTLILHQSNRLNPYINWPFHPNVVPDLTKYARKARLCGVALKIYYTVHELTNHCVELHALSGLNGEVLLRRKSDRPPFPGPGTATANATSSWRMRVRRRKLGQGGDLKGNEWLLEHLVHGYEGAWFTLNPGGEEDAAVFDNVTSRFLNYYIEGQRWLYDNVGIAGLYYDGFNSERKVQQRIRRMSEDTAKAGTTTAHRERQAVRFDVHGRAFEYTELLPYVDSMWTAEGIDFTKNPAYWLVSISALPFGVYGEMLGADIVHPVEGHFCGESCANRFRGMLFGGMTNRAGWNGKDPNDNLHLWRLWDNIAIDEAELYGWWNTSCPIRVVEHSSGSRRISRSILATAYVKHGKLTLVAIASWDALNKTVALEVDWPRLGLTEGSGLIEAPHLPSFNRANHSVIFHPDEAGLVRIIVPAYEGWLLTIS